MIRSSDFVRWVSGTASSAVPEFFNGVSFDSRSVPPGGMFIALKGTNSDGHKFVLNALRDGAGLALVSEEWQLAGDDGLPLVRVKDVGTALKTGARAYRDTLRARVIGVTGSAGKTTTKEFLKTFLSTVGESYANIGNFNNDLGLPVTILNCPDNIDFLITEMGTNHPGEIAQLVNIARPDIGIITSIGTAHIEFFKTQDGIAEEKGTLFSHLSGDGSFAVLAADNDRFDKLREMCKCDVEVTDGNCSDAAWIRNALSECLPGEHNVTNALLAYTCAKRLGAERVLCEKALEGFVLPGNRWNRVKTGGIEFIADCYNANPSSMVVALETFAKEKSTGRKVAVLGDMFELGEQSSALHEMVKTKARTLDIDEIVYVGENFGGVRVTDVKGLLRKGDLVLLKGSHGMHLEEIMKDFQCVE